uniref:Cation efflux protein transmembrane domain-containing protein n=1 Tax=Anopheles maculatus TaxID=74869 RepID=A0A182SGJ6_9DIPT
MGGIIRHLNPAHWRSLASPVQSAREKHCKWFLVAKKDIRNSFEQDHLCPERAKALEFVLRLRRNSVLALALEAAEFIGYRPVFTPILLNHFPGLGLSYSGWEREFFFQPVKLLSKATGGFNKKIHTLTSGMGVVNWELSCELLNELSGIGAIAMGATLHNHGHSHAGGGGGHHEEENINVRAAFIHVLSDFVQSLGVFIAALVIYFKPSWNIIDPICTFVFSILVLGTTIAIMRDAIVVSVK